MVIVDRWLSGKQNYIIGRVLYDVLGNERTVKELFAKGETPFAKNKMVDELKKLNEKSSVQFSSFTIDHSPLVATQRTGDAVMHSLDAEWKEKYARMNLLRHKLDEYGERNDDEARGACATLCKEILELEQQCMKIWTSRNVYEETGHLPEVNNKKIEIPTEAIELGKFIENRKRDMRRYRKKMQDEPAVAKWSQLYNDHHQLYKEATGKEYNEHK
jgi:hypothetical protein